MSATLDALPEPLAAELLLIRGGTVYAPEPLGVADVLLVGERVAAVEPGLGDGPLPMIEIIEAEGLSVLPGFVDNHAHLLGGGGADGYHSRVEAVTAEALLAAGITTVAGMLGLDATTRSLHGLLAHVRGLRELGVSAYVLCGATPWHPVPALTTSPGEDLFLVDEVIGAGEISLSELGYLFDSADGSGAAYVARLAAELWAVAKLTRKSGVVVLQIPPFHGATLRPLFDLIDRTGMPPEQFIPSHVNQSDTYLEAAGRWAREYVGWVDIGVNYDPARGFDRALSPSQAVDRLLERGATNGQILMSTDAGGRIRRADEGGEERGSQVMTPDTLLQSFCSLAREGRPMEVLASWFATNPARALGLSQKGRIAAGSDGDLLLFDADHELTGVVTKGRVHQHPPVPVTAAHGAARS